MATKVGHYLTRKTNPTYSVCVYFPVRERFVASMEPARPGSLVFGSWASKVVDQANDKTTQPCPMAGANK